MVNRATMRRTRSLTFININEPGLTGVLGDLQQRTCANPNMLLEEIEFKKVGWSFKFLVLFDGSAKADKICRNRIEPREGEKFAIYK